jgi:16S rRNA (adenine1518-N6/adenine1519-N6)-dimethyltransferase
VNLADVSELKPFLRRHGLEARKGMGQHFLVSKSVVDSIVACFEGCRGILEIGPGPGVLTGPLSEKVDRMIALEVDDRLPTALSECAPTADVRLENALDADLSEILGELPEPRGVVSNLPYYITGPLLGRITDARRGWSKAVLMMQREVGVRILAKPGERERGGLSVMIQARFEVRRVALVPAGAFYPPPKVDSVVLELIPRPDDYPDALFAFVHKGFAQPRKTLANNLAAAGYTRDLVERAGLSPTIRPHELEFEAWSRLFELSG